MRKIGQQSIQLNTSVKHFAVNLRTIVTCPYSTDDNLFAKTRKIVLVQDNLNTHKPASLYQAFPPAEARRLVERFEWHYTPKHGSWLNMAESELGVILKQCLDRRIPDKATLAREIKQWQSFRNQNHAKADWQFTTDDATH